MCDYCGCREVPEIAVLGAQHEEIVELGDRALELAKMGSPEFGAALEALRAALEPHVAREEAGIFTQAREEGLGAYYVDDLEEDHRRFESGLSDTDRLDVVSLEKLLDELHRHIAIEEYDLFPATHQLFTDREWETVDERLLETPAGSPPASA